MKEQSIVGESTLQYIEFCPLDQFEPARYIQFIDISLLKGSVSHLHLIQTPVLDEG